MDPRIDNLIMMAKYNQWMNRRLYSCATQLDEKQLWADQGAFFGSVMGTLNHLLVGDIIWLQRFSHHAVSYSSLQPVATMNKPLALDSTLERELTALGKLRELVDDVILAFAQQLTADDLGTALSYTNTQGKTYSKRFGLLIQHLFNHQTHHRGQVSTLFYQLGVDIGVTDVLMLIDDE